MLRTRLIYIPVLVCIAVYILLYIYETLETVKVVLL